jgi:GNAT superfamily N-acetyltransferase
LTTLEAVHWDDPEADALRAIQQAELRDLYGTADLEPFIAPEAVAAMILVRVGGVPVACGALRDRGNGIGELKRMFVLPEYRGRGLSRLVLQELERRATALGWERLILETGVLQPEAIGLYLSAGYLPMPNFPPYEDEHDSRCFMKVLPGAAGNGLRPDATGVRATDVTVTSVPFADPVAVALRRAMYEDLVPRYPEFTARVEGTGGFEAMDERLGHDVVVTLVAWLDGVAVGTAGLQPVDDPAYPGAAQAGEVKKVFVRPEARGSGVARCLMSAIEDAAREQGWTELVLQTGSRQPEAITLYVTHGYRPIAPLSPYLGDPLSLCFAKTLSA